MPCSPLARSIPIALALAVALALAPGLALAQPGGPDARGQDEERGANRSEGSGDDREAGGADRGREGDPPGRADPVRIEDRPAGFATRAPQGSARPTVAVDAARAQASVDRPDVGALSLRLAELVAYVDEDDDGAYDLGEPVLERRDLRDLDHQIRDGPGEATRSLVYELPDGGELVVRFDVGTQHGPEVGAKFDVELRNHTAPSPDARLALGTRAEAAGEVEPVELDGAPALAGRQGDEVAYLSWAPTVLVDGAEREVGWSVHLSAASDEAADEGHALLYWSYPQGDEVVHDPTLGVTEAVRDLAGETGPFLAGLAATLAVLAAGYAVRRRGPR